MVAQILHVGASVGVERVEERVVDAVEFQRADAEALAEREVEGRRGLHPAPVQPELAVAMIDEDVGAEAFEQLRRRQVIANVGETDPRRDAERARRGAEQRRLADAPPAAAGQHFAGDAGFRRGEIDVGVVADFVAHREEQADRLRAHAARAGGGARGEGAHRLGIAIDEAARAQKFDQFLAGHRGQVQSGSIAGRPARTAAILSSARMPIAVRVSIVPLPM